MQPAVGTYSFHKVGPLAQKEAILGLDWSKTHEFGAGGSLTSPTWSVYLNGVLSSAFTLDTTTISGAQTTIKVTDNGAVPNTTYTLACQAVLPDGSTDVQWIAIGVVLPSING
jgi:hypothetical protein